MSEKSESGKIVEQRAVEINTRAEFALASSSTKPIDKGLMTGQSTSANTTVNKDKGGSQS